MEPKCTAQWIFTLNTAMEPPRIKKKTYPRMTPRVPGFTSCSEEPSVWVCSGSSTKCHRLSKLNRRSSFLTVLEAGRPLSRCQRAGFWWRPSSCLEDGHLLSASTHGRKKERERENGHSLIFSYKDANPITRTSPSWPYLNLFTSQQPHRQTPSTLGGRTLTHEFGGYTTQPIAPSFVFLLNHRSALPVVNVHK